MNYLSKIHLTCSSEFVLFEKPTIIVVANTWKSVEINRNASSITLTQEHLNYFWNNRFTVKIELPNQVLAAQERKTPKRVPYQITNRIQILSSTSKLLLVLCSSPRRNIPLVIPKGKQQQLPKGPLQNKG